jgi:O-antigen ligase
MPRRNALNDRAERHYSPIFYQPHPDSSLQTLWNATQLGLVVMPFSPLLGGIGISLIALVLLRQRFKPISHRPVNWALLGVAAGMVISAALAYNKAAAFLGLTNFLPLFIVFAALSELIQTPAQLRRIAWILVWGSVPVLVIGFGQLFWGWGGHVQVLGSLVDWVILPTGNPPGRMASIFVFANVLASYLVVTFTLCLGLFVEQVKTGWRHRKSVPLALILLLILVGNAIALILTNSRNAWGIEVFAFLAFALYLGWYWLLAIVTAVTTVILGAAFAPSPLREGLRQIVPAYFWARLTDQLVPNRPIADMRQTQWRFAWSLVEQRPWMGWGLRNFSLLYQEAMHFFIGHPHNLPLMLAAEVGLPTTLIFIGTVGWVVLKGSQLLLDSARIRELSSNGGEPVPGSTQNGSGQKRTFYGGKIASHRLILFTFLVTFMSCTLFSLLDVTLFDIRINLLGWLLLAGIGGLVYHSQREQGKGTGGEA